MEEPGPNQVDGGGGKSIDATPTPEGRSQFQKETGVWRCPFKNPEKGKHWFM